MDFRPNDTEPIYIQVIRYFKQRIAIGDLQPGDTLPTRRELGVRFKLNPNTVQKAFKEMEEQKLIVTEGKLPSRVTSDIYVLGSVKKELVREAITGFVDLVSVLQVPVEELMSEVEKQYNERVQKGE